MKSLVICLMVLVLVACSSKPTTEPSLVFHPQRPVPVKTYIPDWVVVKDNGNSYVGMTYEESLKYRAWLEKIGSYIESQNRMLCIYRKDLKESQCESPK